MGRVPVRISCIIDNTGNGHVPWFIKSKTRDFEGLTRLFHGEMTAALNYGTEPSTQNVVIVRLIVLDGGFQQKVEI